MLPQVFQTLKASSAVKAIVGTNPPRIWKKRVPPSIPRPIRDAYIVWFLVGGDPENQLSGTPPVDRMVIQVDNWHAKQEGVEALALAARDAIEPIAHMTQILLDEHDPEVDLFRISLQFDFWVDRDS